MSLLFVMLNMSTMPKCFPVIRGKEHPLSRVQSRSPSGWQSPCCLPGSALAGSWSQEPLSSVKRQIQVKAYDTGHFTFHKFWNPHETNPDIYSSFLFHSFHFSIKAENCESYACHISSKSI